MSSVDPIAASGARYTERHVPVEGEVELLVRSWQPLRPGVTAAPLIFVAGWVSVVQGWAPMLRALAPEREVYYIETREKASARIPARRLTPEDFRIGVLARDIRQVCAALPVDIGRCVASGSSLGATTMLEALKHGGLDPLAAFFIGPTYRFHTPWFGPGLMALPTASYHLVKHFVLWYLRTFRVDTKREPEQMARYDATLKTADPVRIKCSAKAFADFCVAEGLESITVPVGLAYAESDTLHGADEIRRMVELLPRGVAIPCESNKYLHSEAVAPELARYLASIGVEGESSA